MWGGGAARALTRALRRRRAAAALPGAAGGERALGGRGRAGGTEGEPRRGRRQKRRHGASLRRLPHSRAPQASGRRRPRACLAAAGRVPRHSQPGAGRPGRCCKGDPSASFAVRSCLDRSIAHCGLKSSSGGGLLWVQ